MGGITVKWINATIEAISPKPVTGEEIVKIGHRKFAINHDEPYTVDDFCPGEVFTFSSNAVNTHSFDEAYVFLRKWQQEIRLIEDQAFTLTFFDYKPIGQSYRMTDAFIGFNLKFLKQVW